MMFGRGGTASILTAGLLAATTLTACTDDLDASDPESAAGLIADGLSRLDLTAAPVSGDGATARLRDLTAGMRTKPSVKVVSVGRGDFEHQRKVLLRATWKVASADWTYRGSFQLKNIGERWQATWSPTLVHPDLRPGERLATREEPPERADIMGRDGRPIVTSRGVFRIGVDRSMTTDDRADALALAHIVDIDPKSYARKVDAHGPEAFVEAIVLRVEDVPPEMTDRLRSVPGASRIRDDLPLAPTATFAAPVLGKVGAATAEVVHRSKGRVEPGQQVGLSGLQADYDKELSGEPAVTIHARREQSDGTAAERVLGTVGGAAGEPLHLTLDTALQSEAEKLLARHKRAQCHRGDPAIDR